MQLWPRGSWQYKVQLHYRFYRSLGYTRIQGLIIYEFDHFFRTLKCIHHTNKGNTGAHLYWRAVPHWQNFHVLPENDTSAGGIIRPIPRSIEGRETNLLDQSQGQSTAVGASDCKTLINVRRLKPPSHLAGMAASSCYTWWQKILMLGQYVRNKN